MAEMRSSAEEIARAKAEVPAERVREVVGRGEAAAGGDVGHGRGGLAPRGRRRGERSARELETAGQDVPWHRRAAGGEHPRQLAFADADRRRDLVRAQAG